MIVIEVWIENLKICEPKNIIAKIKKYTFDYDRMTNICQNFFLVYFFMTQIICILFIFTSLMTLQVEKDGSVVPLTDRENVFFILSKGMNKKM